MLAYILTSVWSLQIKRRKTFLWFHNVLWIEITWCAGQKIFFFILVWEFCTITANLHDNSIWWKCFVYLLHALRIPSRFLTKDEHRWIFFYYKVNLVEIIGNSKWKLSKAINCHHTLSPWYIAWSKECQFCLKSYKSRKNN